MNTRLRSALLDAAENARNIAESIRKELPEDDGDPEARIVTPDGCTEDDAEEWDADARLIEAMLADRVGGPTTVVKELETENQRLRVELARRVPNADDLRVVLDQVRVSRVATAAEVDAVARVRATMEES